MVEGRQEDKGSLFADEIEQKHMEADSKMISFHQRSSSGYERRRECHITTCS
jgi:hypothetical protein